MIEIKTSCKHKQATTSSQPTTLKDEERRRHLAPHEIFRKPRTARRKREREKAACYMEKREANKEQGDRGRDRLVCIGTRRGGEGGVDR